MVQRSFRRFTRAVEPASPRFHPCFSQVPLHHGPRVFFFFFFCNTSPKSLLESPQEASPSYRVSPTSQVTVSGWGSREGKGAVDSGFAFVQNN